MRKYLCPLFFVLMTIQGIQAQPDRQNSPADSLMISIATGFADAFNAHDLDAILSFMSDDCVFLASSGPDAEGEKFEGKDEVRKAFEDVFNTYPDARWSNVTSFTAGNRTVTEWLFTGTRKDGSRVEVNGCDLCTFRDGKIILKNSYRKNRPAITK